MRDLRRFFCGLAAVSCIAVATNLSAQVTTATLLGEVRDSSGAAVPGATVIAKHQGTGVPREAISNDRGEFVLTALPTGPYSVTISLTGFKTYTNEGMVLGAGQTVRQAFTLEIGTVEESVLVSGEAPIVESAASLQAETIGSQEVRELPVNRRNLTNLLSVAPGVSTSPGGDVQMNGVAGGGTGITVDGTEANSNPEERSMSHYGGQNQISVMSLDSIAEVQVVRGVLPAEYGGVAGGQVNVISRSGTNSLSGSAFYNFQSPTLNARSFFSTTPKGTGSFNQYGGTLGGPVLRNKLFFFTTYEGYREEVELNLTGNVPYQNTRDALLAALPFPETKIAFDTLPEPTEPIVSAAGVVDAVRGRYRGLATRKRTENHVVVKGDFSVFNGANVATTYTRMRPWTLEPRFNVNGSNDRVFPNAQDRIASHFVMAHGQWVSESRFGWNRTDLQRLDEFFNVMDPDPRAPAEIGNFGRRVGLINISGLFSTPSAEIYDLTGGTWSFDQKLSRTFGRHFIKTGFRWVRQTGDKMSPQNPQFAYQNLADTLANIPQSITVSFGAPRYKSHIDEFGGFIQDDWRLGSNLVLNLGVRYDYYATIRVTPTTEVPAEIVNLAPPTDLKKMDFGPPLDPQHPYEPDTFNVGPRLGFAWTLGSDHATVVRGGVGYLFSPHLPATVRQSVADPYVGFRQIWNRTEVAARRLTWPDYNDDFRNVVLADGAGRKTIFSVFDPEISAPYTIQSMLSVQRGIGRTMAVEVGYVRTNGRSLPLQRQFTLAFDRQTGARPNPSLGAPGGYYVDSNQTLIYDGLQTSLRKRFSNRYSFDVNYTLGKGIATQGGDLAAYYLASIGNTQDFWDPEFDRGPADNDIRHRVNGTFIYEVPGISGGQGLINGVFGGWQISGILSAASGSALTITQPSGITASRPDVRPGEDLVLDDWEDTCNATGCSYLNPAAFVAVPVSSVTTATVRPGNYKVGQARGPANWLLNATVAKNFGVGGQRRLQVRADMFNALNKLNYGSPNSNITSTDFGRISGADNARTMQLGMRLSF
jgi:Carboxypeptidase regulatory-like domain/TonB dependent receptor-like, beta-barrel/TonB-dependent Receptor Plug Domain